MNEINCHLIQDLIPLYIDGLTSDPTNRIIQEHLQSCKDCNKIYDYMKRPSQPQKQNILSVDINVAKRLQRISWINILKFALVLILSFLGYSIFCIFSQNFVIQKYGSLFVLGIISYFLIHNWIEPLLSIVISSVSGALLCSLIFHSSFVSFILPLPEVALFVFGGYCIAASIVSVYNNKIAKTISVGILALSIITSFGLSFSGIVDLGVVWLESLPYAYSHNYHLNFVEFAGPLDFYVAHVTDTKGVSHTFSINSYIIDDLNPKA